MPVKCLIQQRHQANDPTMESEMADDNAALCHHLFQAA
ncbi:hypothetical protein FHR25_004892 [Yokenella regensburgei]|nr:hypothetical protein FHR25_004892 [Yokenella regensburgei]